MKKLFVLLCILSLIGCAQKPPIETKPEPEALSDEEYATLFEAVTASVSASGEFAYGVCSFTSDIWYDAIYEEWRSETEKYVRKGPKLNSGFYDFNTAIEIFHESEEFASFRETIEDSKTNIKRGIRDLKKPPQSYEDAYNILSDAYVELVALSDLSISPVGTYDSYMDSVREHKDALDKALTKMDLVLP